LARLLLGLAYVIVAVLCGACDDGPAAPTGAPSSSIDLSQPWVHVTPAMVDMDSARLEGAARAAAAIPRFRSLLVARHGRVVLERYFGGADATTPFDVRSVTKSVVALLTGVALADGAIPDLGARLGDYLLPIHTLDAGDSAVTVRELLTMTSGYSWNELGDGPDFALWRAASDHVQYLLDRPQIGPPGPFEYNSAAVHVLGIVLQNAESEPLPQFATRSLFEPAGITSARWEELEYGTVNGAAGLSLTAPDLLRIGQLLLQEGRSGDRSVVPGTWVRAMTSPRFGWREVVGPQSGVSYGYLCWVADGSPNPAYFAWGYGGQFVYVVPSLDLVVTSTTDWRSITNEEEMDSLEANVLEVIVDLVESAALG
jgi:CubicO group peptidase (beta-lactamase class C family)